MADWELISISFSEQCLSKNAWNTIANLIGGEVYTASELGITSIEFTVSDVSVSDYSQLAVYVPNGAEYGVIAWGGGGTGTYYRNCSVFAIPLTQGDIQATGSIPWGINRTHTNARVLAGNGFSIISSKDTTYTTGVLAFDTFHDEINDEDVIGAIGSRGGTQYYAINLSNGDILTGKPIGMVQTQTDGSLYVELIKTHAVKLVDNLIHSVIVSENLYHRLYDYNEQEKNVLINGIKFSSVLTTEIFFPTE